MSWPLHALPGIALRDDRPRPPAYDALTTHRPDGRAVAPTSERPSSRRSSEPQRWLRLRRKATLTVSRPHAHRRDPPDAALRAAGVRKTVAVAGWLVSRAIAHGLALAGHRRQRSRPLHSLPGRGPATSGQGLARDGRPHRPGRQTPASICRATLLEELAASDDPFVLVLDDYQVVSAEPVHRLVRFLIERGPPFVHLVVLTRADPPLPLARLRAQSAGRSPSRRPALQQSGGLSLSRRGGCHARAELVERLLDRTEGWIAGLQLAAISLRDRPDAAALIEDFHGSQRFVLDYLADEVLAGLDDDLRSFLVRTSVADRLTAELCRELTGREMPPAARAGGAGQPVPGRLDAGRHWYRYHGLFADYLRSQLDEAERRQLTSARPSTSAGPAPTWRRSPICWQPARSTARRPCRAHGTADIRGRGARDPAWLARRPAPGAVRRKVELVSLQGWALFLTGRMAAAKAATDGHPLAPGSSEPVAWRLYALRALLARSSQADPTRRTSHGSPELLGTDDAIRALTLLRWGRRSSLPASRRALSRPCAGRSRQRATPDRHDGRRRGDDARAWTRRARADPRPRRSAGGCWKTLWAREAEKVLTPGTWRDGFSAWSGTRRATSSRRVASSSEDTRPPPRLASLASRLAPRVVPGPGPAATGSPEAALEAVRAVARDAHAAGVTRVAAQAAETEARIVSSRATCPELRSGPIGRCPAPGKDLRRTSGSGHVT